MQTQINAPHESLPDPLVDLIERSVDEGLEHYATRLTQVIIHIQDLNAHKGGIDKRCLIEARPKGLDPLTAEHEDEEITDAFRGALDKLKRVLERRFGKLSSRKHEA